MNIKAQIVEALQTRPDSTSDQLSVVVGVTPDCVRRKLRELSITGIVAETGKVGERGNKASIWKVVREPSVQAVVVPVTDWTRPPVKYVENRIWGI